MGRMPGPLLCPGVVERVLKDPAQLFPQWLSHLRAESEWPRFRASWTTLAASPSFMSADWAGVRGISSPWDEFTSVDCPLTDHAVRVQSKNSTWPQIPKVVSYLFLKFPSLHLMFKSTIHFELVSISGMRFRSGPLFACGCPIAPTPFVERLFFLPLHLWQPPPSLVGLLLGPQCVPLIPVSVRPAPPRPLGYGDTGMVPPGHSYLAALGPMLSMQIPE